MASVARGNETCASKVPLARQMTSAADSECPAPQGFYVGRGQPGSLHIHMFVISKIFTSVLECYCNFTSNFYVPFITAIHLAVHTIVF